MTKLCVDLVSDFDSPTGYSAHARALISSLLMIDCIDLKLVPNKADRATVDLPDDVGNNYRELMAKNWETPDVRIHFEIPNNYRFGDGAYVIGFTQWETSKIPDKAIARRSGWDWVSRMNEADEIWTSGKEAELAFQRSGVNTPVVIVPGPIDTDLFKPGLPEMKIRGLTSTEDGVAVPKGSRPKVIGFFGAWSKRKNIEDWVVWMKTQFSPKYVAGLLKTSIGTIATGDQRQLIGERIESIAHTCTHVRGADIHFVHEKLTDEQVAHFFQTPDLYVSFSRGEGLDLPTLQAMASGCLVMHTDWGATTDFLTPKTGFPIPYQLEPVAGMQYVPYWGDQWWARANLHAATNMAGNILSTMDEKPDAYDEMRRKAREIVVERSSIPAISKLLEKQFKRIQAKLMAVE